MSHVRRHSGNVRRDNETSDSRRGILTALFAVDFIVVPFALFLVVRFFNT